MEKDLKQTISAGGVVRKKINNKIYIILCRDSAKHDWILPKGHVEKDETIENAATREVKEETGLENVKIGNKLGIKQRKSFEGDEWKTIHYFLFDTNENRRLKNIIDNGKVLTPKWFSIDNLPNLFWQEQKEIIQNNLEIIKNI